MELEENKEMWNTFFLKCGLSEEQVQRIESTLLERVHGEGAIYDLDEIVTDFPWWTKQHNEDFPRNKLADSEKKEILEVAVKMIQEQTVEHYRQIQRYQEGQEEMKDSALIVTDMIIDGEMVLEARVRGPDLKRVKGMDKITKNDIITKNTWIADSGASTHMGNSDEGMTDVRIIDSLVQIGNGSTSHATKIGKKHLTVISKDGSMMNVVLEDYKYVPDLWVNLFALTKCLQNNWNIGNKGLTLHLWKGTSKIRFDRVIPTHKGVIIGVEMVARNPDVTNVASAPFESGKTIDVNVFAQSDWTSE